MKDHGEVTRCIVVSEHWGFRVIGLVWICIATRFFFLDLGKGARICMFWHLGLKILIYLSFCTIYITEFLIDR